LGGLALLACDCVIDSESIDFIKSCYTLCSCHESREPVQAVNSLAKELKNGVNVRANEN